MSTASSPPPIISNPLSVPPYQHRRAPGVNWSSHPAHQPAMAVPRITVHPLPVESPALLREGALDFLDSVRVGRKIGVFSSCYTITHTITGCPGQRRVAEAISHHPPQPPPPLIMDDPVTDQYEGYSHPRHQKGKPSGPSQLEAWLQLHSTVLDELLCRDGFWENLSGICTCGSPGQYRCCDCFNGTLTCKECIISAHLMLPLHHIETLISNRPLYARWGHPFSLAIVAIVVQRPSQLHIILQSWMLVGVHVVSLCFCGCYNAQSRYIQLLRAGWYPMTIDLPHAAATFTVLECFHELTLQGKLNIFDFYNALLRISDGSGVTDFTNRYNDLSRIMRQWHHIMSLKQAGHGHNPARIKATSAGSLSFFVEESAFQAVIAESGECNEGSTCQVEHDAIVHANVHNKDGYITSGLGAVMCARHILVRCNGIADLQKGEKYINMDYILFSTLIGVQCLMLFLSYDIACHYHKRLLVRMEDLPSSLHFNHGDTEMCYAVPKYDLRNHGKDCQDTFSLNYIHGSGQTCGEGIETAWAHLNGIGTSTHEMLPGGRHKTINDHWTAWNWRKTVNFGSSLLAQFKEAFAMHHTHQKFLESYTTTFPPTTICTWSKAVEDWEADMSKPNPYRDCTTLADIRLQLAKEDMAAATQDHVSMHEVTPSNFPINGLELEDQQYTLTASITALKGKGTSSQLADIQQKRTALLRRIQNWRDMQQVYMPCVMPSQDRQSEDNNTDTRSINAKDLCLHLPSSLPSPTVTLLSLTQLVSLEFRLRVAQADDSLEDVRCNRCITQSLYQFKKGNISGTGNKANTRSHTTMTCFVEKSLAATDHYEHARKALLALALGGNWQTQLCPLNRADIRGPGKDDEEFEGRQSEGRREPSWIWMVPRVTANNDSLPDGAITSTADGLNDNVRIEWTKARVRVQRWHKEELVVVEEMRQVLAFFEWKAVWWLLQASLCTNITPALCHGLSANAHKQASILTQLATKFARLWLPVLKGHGVEPVWQSKYISLSSGSATALCDKVYDHVNALSDNDVIEDVDPDMLEGSFIFVVSFFW
ncbi:hypothetical protein DEU56DRAFT_912194 [Suillus clintonianus]|uniref:uncharacterized protein n=1 Tax=Suillus clintonianus TaxID=1904413 RepID=UPI001B87B1B9|nr:uncharacterized protein DEU56DRAFT_912194 [Suillus clintonianus]KAG2139354.1 hypothetical protein DEU56DRAFT_912194 [Suillus clintonianus]